MPIAFAPLAVIEGRDIARAALDSVLGQAAGAQQGGSPLMTFGFLAVMVVIFYFFLIRPQSKQAKEHKAMLAALKKGDVVVTSGGIIGEIHSVSEKFLMVEVAPSVRIRVLPGSVSAKAPEDLLKEAPKVEVKQ